MLLSNTVFFPNTILPLFIFEERYRLMLTECLDGPRFFGVALVNPGIDEVRSEADVHHVAGVGLIRACVGQPDGTSSLVLQGVARTRVLEFDRSRPYWQGKVKVLTSTPRSSRTLALETELISRCGRFGELGKEFLPQLQGYKPGTSDAAVLADVVAAGIVDDVLLRQILLEEQDTDVRLQLLVDAFG